MKQTFNIIATAAAGLEAVVGREVRALGYDCQVENGRVRFEGDVKTIIINYTSDEIQVNGTSVAANSAAVVEGGVK